MGALGCKVIVNTMFWSCAWVQYLVWLAIWLDDCFESWPSGWIIFMSRLVDSFICLIGPSKDK